MFTEEFTFKREQNSFRISNSGLAFRHVVLRRLLQYSKAEMYYTNTLLAFTKFFILMHNGTAFAVGLTLAEEIYTNNIEIETREMKGLND